MDQGEFELRPPRGHASYEQAVAYLHRNCMDSLSKKDADFIEEMHRWLPGTYRRKQKEWIRDILARIGVDSDRIFDDMVGEPAADDPCPGLAVAHSRAMDVLARPIVVVAPVRRSARLMEYFRNIWRRFW